MILAGRSHSGLTAIITSNDEIVDIIPAENTRRKTTGHSDWIECLTFSPDGQILVSGSADHRINLWNWQTGALLHTLKGHSDRVLAVAVSPDGQTLVSGANDKTLKLWNLSTGKLMQTIPASAPVHSVVITPLISRLNRSLLIAGVGQTIHIWDWEAKNQLQTLVGHGFDVIALALTAENQRLISGAIDGIKLWDLCQGEQIYTIKKNAHQLESMAIPPGGQPLVSSHDEEEKTIKLWNLKARQPLQTLTGHSSLITSWIRGVAITPDGKTIISGSWDKTIKIWGIIQ